MKIAFFEVENWEKRHFRRKLKEHTLSLFSENLSQDSVNRVKDADIISTFIYSNIDKPFLDALPALKMIATRSTGFDHIDINECKRKGIMVSNVPSHGENTVAEHTFGLILSLSRRLCRACIKRLEDDYTSEGLKGFDLMGKTLGVIGTGRIGLHVIRIARGFGMNVLAYDINQNQLIAEVMGFSYVSLEEFLGESHIITLHIPYNAHTHHLIDRERLNLM